MSLLGSQVFANDSTPCWLSTGGGEVNGPVTVKDGLSIIPTVESGSSAIVLGPGDAPNFPYSSLIISTPVDITTTLGSELEFYTRENIPDIPPALAMKIDSVQDILMTGDLTVSSINGEVQKVGATRFGTYTQPPGPGTTSIANADIEAGSIIYITPVGALANAGVITFTPIAAAGLGFASISQGPQTLAQPMAYYVIKW